MAPSLPSSALVVVNRDGLYPFDESVWERFWAKVDVRGVDECWEWQGSRHPQGYGQLGVGQRTFRAHRIIASALVGRHLRGAIELACHRCDNPPCVNPKHIFVGDALENSRDMVRKGRHATGGKTRPRGRAPARAQGRRPHVHRALLAGAPRAHRSLGTVQALEPRRDARVARRADRSASSQVPRADRGALTRPRTGRHGGFNGHF